MSDVVAGWDEAWAEAEQGLAENGVPIGAALVRTADGHVLGRGHNLRYQTGDITAHAEIVALRHAGTVPLAELRATTMVSTALPCFMCAGTIVHLGIRRVVVGVAEFGGQRLPSHQFLLDRGVDVVDLGRMEVVDAIMAYAAAHPGDWLEDFGSAHGEGPAVA